jgi:cathepsin L
MFSLFFLFALLGTNLLEFESWRIKHNKTYDSEINVTSKFENWIENSKFIEGHNAENSDFKLGLNKFADIGDEWYYRTWKNSKMWTFIHAPPVEKEEVPGLPESVDWRKKNAVTHIKDQAQCGSCWAFSAVGSMEGQHAIHNGTLVSLSESQVVDCDVNGGDEGCGGGWMDGAFQYVINQGGIEPEKDYPYTPEDEPCTFNKSDIAAKFSGFKDVTGGEAGLKEAVANVGPISVAIDASMSTFQFYKSGVYYDVNCSQTMLDHGVLVVGYGTTSDNKDYWIVKNSWGTSWGDKGYILMARNRNNNCGIATKPSYPTV